MMIQDRLERIPEKYRRVFYALPLFVQWIIGITFERSEKAMATARRSMGFFLLYITAMLTVQLTLALVFSFVPSTDYVLSWIAFVVQGIFGLGYLAGSIYLGYCEWAEKSAAGFGIVDKIALRFEQLASR